MIRSRRVEKVFIVWLMAMATVLGGLNTAVAVEGDLPRLLPADTFLYLVIPNGITSLQEKLEKTSLFGLYKDPAMQQFVVPVEKVIREKIDERIKETWEELDMDEPPEKLPLPTGRVVFAMRMGTKTRKITQYDWESVPSYDPESGEPRPTPEIKSIREVEEPSPQFVFIAELGDNIDALKEIAEKAAEKAADKGAKVEQETIREIQMQTITFVVPEPAEGARSMFYRPRDPPDPVCYAFAGDTALLSNDADMLRDVLARIGGASTDSLADSSQMEEAMKALGGPGDVNGYWNIATMINSMMATVPAEHKARREQRMRAMGFDNIVGLAMVAHIVPNETQELQVKGMLTVDGEMRGIPALLTPISGNTSGHHLLTKGLASFIVANYDAEKIFNQINEMVQAMGIPDINIQLAKMMEATSMNDPAGRPAVDFHKEVLGQLNSPVTVLYKVNKPYTDPGASRTLVALGVRDGAVLETALGRIHETFIARGNKDLKRELLDTNIFLMPQEANPLAMIFGMGRRPAGPEKEEDMGALAVAGNNLVIGSVAGVEQAIRDLRREDLESIETDSLYGQAAGHLPAEAGAWSYENHQIAGELLWTQLRETARKLAKDTDDEDAEGQISLQPGWSMVFGNMIEEFDEVDFGILPDFEAVKKYFGAYIAHMKGTEQGIYFEGIMVKAVPDR